MRAVLGSIGWVARLCRPELCYGCSSLQGKQSKPTVEDLRNTNKLLASAQKTQANGIRFMKGKFVFEEAILLSVTDASHAAEVATTEGGVMQGHRSQSGRFLLMAGHAPEVGRPADCHILEWQSQTLKRVLSSMLGSEAAQQVRITLYSLTNPRIPGDRGMGWKILAADSKLILWYSDCRSFIDYMSATTPGSITDKRMAIDMTALRQELWRADGEEIGDPSSSPKMPIDGKDQLIWICTADMLSDQLTKSMRWDAIRNLCTSGCFPVTVTPVRAGFQNNQLDIVLERVHRADEELQLDCDWPGRTVLRGLCNLVAGVVEIMQGMPSKGVWHVLRSWLWLRNLESEAMMFDGHERGCVRSTALLALGVFNLFVSMLPPTAMKAAGWATGRNVTNFGTCWEGFHGGRDVALSQLRSCWEEGGIQAPFAGMVLIGFCVDVSSFLGEFRAERDDRLHTAKEILDWANKQYPGAFFFAGLEAGYLAAMRDLEGRRAMVKHRQQNSLCRVRRSLCSC
eukprot:s254_g9.t1